MSVYWWDDHRLGRHCAAPASWRLTYRKPDGTWEPVRARGEYGTKLDEPNAIEFDPVETTALRIEARLRPDLSAGILQWQVTPAVPPGPPGLRRNRIDKLNGTLHAFITVTKDEALAAAAEVDRKGGGRAGG